MEGENLSLFQSIMRNPWALATIIVLIFCSLISIFFMVERFLRYRKADADTDLLLGKIRKLIKKGGKFSGSGVPQAVEVCRETNGPVAAVLRAGLIRSSLSKEDIEEAMKKTALFELAKLEKHLVVIGSIGSVAPFIGLLGTVIGVTESFRTLAVVGGGGIGNVGAGIAQALIATIVGLFVAIPAVLGYNYLVSRVSAFTTAVTTSSVELTNIIFNKDNFSDKGEENA
jgi:biopolymer transport protein ExbB